MGRPNDGEPNIGVCVGPAGLRTFLQFDLTASFEDRQLPWGNR